MKRRNTRIFLLTAAALCILLLSVRLTGAGIHAVLGLILTVISVTHIIRHYGRIRKAPEKIQAVYILLMVSLALVFASGILLHPLKQYTWLKGVHGLAGIVFCISVMVHVYQCRRQAGK